MTSVLYRSHFISAPLIPFVIKNTNLLLNNGFNKSDDSVEEYPFTNGAFYINRKIDLYVRRQDPYNEFSLYNDSDIKGNITDFTKEDNYIKEADIEC